MESISRADVGKTVTLVLNGLTNYSEDKQDYYKIT